MPTEVMTTYTFGYGTTSYFSARDGVVSRSPVPEGGVESIRINVYGDRMAVNVKDREGAWLPSLPEDVRAMAEQINAAEGPQGYPFPDAKRTDALYEIAREHWWEDADELAEQHGFSGCFSEGRLGGWCRVEDTRDLATDFSSEPTPVDITDRIRSLEDCEDAPGLTDEMYHELEKLIAMRERDRFLACAFDLVDNIAGAREEFAERIREEFAELEARREDNIVRGEN